ncbi:MAG: RNA polymerase sigma factor [Pseudomonadota bacterium]
MLAERDLLNEMEGLKKFAIKLCGNHADADDLLQTTILKALKNKDKFETDSRVFSWLSRIMFNSYVTDYKRKAKYETQYDPEPAIMAATVAPNQEDKMMISEIQEAMTQLSAEHRQMLMMVCAYGMSYEEVADKLGIPTGTVRSRLSRARDTLQGMLTSNDNHTRVLSRQAAAAVH